MFLEGCAHNVSVQATGRGGEPEILHGRMIAPNAPIARQLLEHVAALARSIPQVGADVAESAMRTAVHLIIAALSRQARLGGSAQAAIRAARPIACSNPREGWARTSSTRGCATRRWTSSAFRTCRSPTSPTAWVSVALPISRARSAART